MNKKQIILILLVFTILLGTSLRLYNLGTESLWLDEGYALKESNQKNIKQVLDAVIGPPEGTPPLYFLTLHYWINIFGISEFSLRFPSVIFSVISIYIIFLLGKDLFDKKTGLIAALITSLSMIQILYSQEARSYSLFTMLTLISSLFYVKLLKSRRNSFCYLISTSLMMYAHYLGIFVLFFQNAVYLLFYKKFNVKFKKWLLYVAALTLLYIPGVFIMISQFKHNQHSLQSSLGIKLGLPSFISNLGALNFLWPALFTLLIIGIILYLKIDITKFIKQLRFNQNLFFGFSLIIFILGIFLIPKLTNSLFITRYSHFSYPFFYILLAKGFTKVKKINLRKIMIILFIILVVFSLFNYHFKFPRKEQWKEAASFIESNFKQDDVIILIDNDIENMFLYYYNSSSTISIHSYKEHNKNLEELDRLKLSIDNDKSYWLVLSHAYKSREIYKSYFDENYILVEEMHLKEIDIFYYS